MLRKGAYDVKLCPRCYLRGRLERLQGTTLALPCLGCGTIYTASDYYRARAMTLVELHRRLSTASRKEAEDVTAAPV